MDLIDTGRIDPCGSKRSVNHSTERSVSIGDPACDLRSNIAAESRAKIIYERLINITEDSGIKDALAS